MKGTISHMLAETGGEPGGPGEKMSNSTKIYLAKLQFALSAERRAFEAVLKLRCCKDSYERCMGYFLYRRDQMRGWR